MSVEIRVPAVGESITEVQIARWLKQEGERVEADEALAVLETDKVTVELAAPVAGVLARVGKVAGQQAAVGEVIAYLEAGLGRDDSGAVGGSGASGASSASPTAPAAGGASELRLMPAARRLAAEHGLDPAEIAPSGPGGRVLAEDVLRQVAARSAPAPAAPAGAADARGEELVPLTPLRKRIAERLLQAQQTTAMLTTFNEIDMSAVVALRAERGAAFREEHGVKLGFMSFFVKAAADALARVPVVNAELLGDAVLYRKYCDIGVAIGGGKGLVVPVLRGAEGLSFAEIERRIADLAARAETGKLRLEELQGGTFTISNGGVYGSLLSTPILNPPQSGILGLHAIQDRPVARGGAVVIRPMMYVALSYDHRLVDGREAVGFLKRVVECVEQPARLLLGV